MEGPQNEQVVSRPKIRMDKDKKTIREKEQHQAKISGKSASSTSSSSSSSSCCGSVAAVDESRGFVVEVCLEKKGEEKLRQHAGSGKERTNEQTSFSGSRKNQEESSKIQTSSAYGKYKDNEDYNEDSLVGFRKSRVKVETSMSSAVEQTNQAEMIRDSAKFIDGSDLNDQNDNTSFLGDKGLNLSSVKRSFVNLDNQSCVGLMQIVESAETKLMRQQREAKQQAGGEFVEEMPSFSSSSSLVATRERIKKQPKSLLLLKSPAFAKNTLDDKHLDKLATENEVCGRFKDGTSYLEDVSGNGSGFVEFIGEESRRRTEKRQVKHNDIGGVEKYEQQFAEGKLQSLTGASATNMTNRLNEERKYNDYGGGGGEEEDDEKEEEEEEKKQVYCQEKEQQQQQLNRLQKGSLTDKQADGDISSWSFACTTTNSPSSQPKSPPSKVFLCSEASECCFEKSSGWLLMEDKLSKGNEIRLDSTWNLDLNPEDSHSQERQQRQRQQQQQEGREKERERGQRENITINKRPPFEFTKRPLASNGQNDEFATLLAGVSASAESSRNDHDERDEDDQDNCSKNQDDGNQNDHQQDDEQDEREGPTPTNDLIRALIHKDRLALGVSVAGQKSQGNKTQGWPASTTIRATCNSTSSSSNKQQSSSSSLQLSNISSSKESSEERKQRSSVFNLSALIGKCQKLQLSPSSSSNLSSPRSWPSRPEASDYCKRLLLGKQTAAATLRTTTKAYQQTLLGSQPRCSSPRKPSDPSALVRAQKVAKENQQEQQQQIRRHSTYMLPILLNSITPRPGEKTSSSSEEDDEDDGGGGDGGGPDDDDGEQEELVDGDLGEEGEGHNEENSPGTSLSPSSNEDGFANQSACNLEEDLDQDLLMVEARDFKKPTTNSLQARHYLPNSASSPSALSTPTLENPRVLPICDQSCCALQTSNANSRLPQAPKPPRSSTCKQSIGRCEIIKQQIFARLNQQQHQQPFVGRKRLGSNPLDRFWHTNVDNKRPIKRTNNKKPLSEQRSALKRHSIINIFSGNHQPQARHSHPRLMFASNSQHHQQQLQNTVQNHNINRNELQNTYEPLIPESGFKIVVMGTSGSGKTSIIQRFMYNSFSWRHLPTVEDTYFIEFPYMKNTINISVSDTSGTYQFPAMRKLAINSGDAFILVYSVDNAQSLDELETLRQTILDEREQAYLEASGSCSINSNDSSSLTSALASGANTSASSSSIHLNNFAPAGHLQQQLPHYQQQQQHHHHQLYQQNHPPPAAVTANFAHNELTNKESMPPPHHWSLASLFHNNHNHQHNTNQPFACHQSTHSSVAGHTSLGSSICPSSSNCSSTDNSRRSSVSAAEAALKTRRTRHPPMVIVANKHDLPEEQHVVDSDEIEALAVIDWNNGFVRASAALDWNINEIFQQVLKQARQPPTLADAIVSKRRKSLPPKLPHSIISNHMNSQYN